MAGTADRNDRRESLAQRALAAKARAQELGNTVAAIAADIARTEEDIARVHDDIAAGDRQLFSDAGVHAEKARRFAAHERQEHERWSKLVPGDVPAPELPSPELPSPEH